jgi:hypothetical protein
MGCWYSTWLARVRPWVQTPVAGKKKPKNQKTKKWEIKPALLHPGYSQAFGLRPILTDWSCCKRRTHFFSYFLSTVGCTKGRHKMRSHLSQACWGQDCWEERTIWLKPKFQKQSFNPLQVGAIKRPNTREPMTNL